MAKKWTEAELDILREQYNKRPLKETVIFLNRSKAAANNMACRLGLKKGNFKIDWPDWKIKMLRDHYPYTNTKTIAEWLGVSHKTIKNKAMELGLEKAGTHKRTSTRRTEEKSHRFSAEDGEYIRTHMGHERVKDIAAHLGFTSQSVWNYCKRHGIPHSREVTAEAKPPEEEKG